jgi:hypothetical protein
MPLVGNVGSKLSQFLNERAVGIVKETDARAEAP